LELSVCKLFKEFLKVNFLESSPLFFSFPLEEKLVFTVLNKKKNILYSKEKLGSSQPFVFFLKGYFCSEENKKNSLQKENKKTSLLEILHPERKKIQEMKISEYSQGMLNILNKI
jgi:hypothetical protein